MNARLILLAALPLAACDSTGPEPIATPDQLGIQIVSGDHQTEPVASSGASANVVPTGPRMAAGACATCLPQPLVARITIDGASLSLSGAGTRPSATVLPPTTIVTYRVIQPEGVGDRHCGASYVDSAIPDTAAEVTTYWELGTYAGECRMEVRLIADGQPLMDTAFVATFTPGPVAGRRSGSLDWEAQLSIHVDTVCARSSYGVCQRIVHDTTWAAFPGDTIDLALASLDVVLADQYGNPIGNEDFASQIGWAFYGGAPLGGPGGPERFGNPMAPTGSVRLVVPDCHPDADYWWYTDNPDSILCGNVGVKIWYGDYFSGGVRLSIARPGYF